MDPLICIVDAQKFFFSFCNFYFPSNACIVFLTVSFTFCWNDFKETVINLNDYVNLKVVCALNISYISSFLLFVTYDALCYCRRESRLSNIHHAGDCLTRGRILSDSSGCQVEN